MFRWILNNKLASGPRPRAPSQRLGQVPKVAVDAWIDVVTRDLGVRSIICLLDQQELQRYKDLPSDLLSYYRAQGFKVAHIPAANHRRPRLSNPNLKKVWKAYKELPKPVLIHCSAGISRTGAAVRYIKQRDVS